MKNVSWIQAKEAVNRCMSIINPKLDSVTCDFVEGCADGNLPSVLKYVAVHAFLYGKEKFGKDALIIRNALEQLENKAFIGEAGERDEKV